MIISVRVTEIRDAVIDSRKIIILTVYNNRAIDEKEDVRIIFRKYEIDSDFIIAGLPVEQLISYNCFHSYF